MAVTPGLSTSDPGPVNGKAVKHDPSAWTSATYMGILDDVPGSWL